MMGILVMFKFSFYPEGTLIFDSEHQAWTIILKDRMMSFKKTHPASGIENFSNCLEQRISLAIFHRTVKFIADARFIDP
jgi:hypothetical protein